MRCLSGNFRLVGFLFSFAFAFLSFGRDCWRYLNPKYDKWTDKYAFIMESGSGAVGDVVGVTVFLKSQLAFEGSGPIAVQIVVCHDDRIAEIEGEPVYSGQFLSMLYMSGVYFFKLPFCRHSDPGWYYGFFIDFGLRSDGYHEFFPSDLPVPLFTVYYRLKGKPGDVCELRFCDGTFEGNESIECRLNYVHTYWPDNPPGFHFYSTVNQGGTIRVLDGPATHPNRPPEPPKAKVYPYWPTPQEANFRVRITDAVAKPGGKEVPVEVYVSADVEYVGIAIPIDFDERYLRLSRAEDHFLSGTVLIDNRNELPGPNPEEGFAVVFSGYGVNQRRLAEEGEEIHAATLYFDVLEEASETLSTAITSRPVTDSRGTLHEPYIIVRFAAGGKKGPENSGEPLKAQEVSEAKIPPIAVSEGRILVAPDALVLRGDSNLDGRLDLADPICILAYLFAGAREPLCIGAADFNRDGRIDIGDPISELKALFNSLPANHLEVTMVPCR